jgi:hypothetical protein
LTGFSYRKGAGKYAEDCAKPAAVYYNIGKDAPISRCYNFFGDLKMKQTVQKLLNNETFIAILLILLTTLLTYGVSIPNLGYYRDDWYLLWSGQARGAASIIPLFSTDRPFMGVVYSFVYRLLGDTIVNWHLYALLWRFIGGMAFFWILRLLWPNHKYLTTVMTVLFIVYPGFYRSPMQTRNRIISMDLARPFFPSP